MKNFVRFLLVLAIGLATNASAYEVYHGVAGKQYSDSVVLVNGKDGIPALQQDMISNINSSQTTRTFGYVFGRNPVVNNVRCDMWEGPTCTYVFPASAIQMAVVSSSASDAAAGTGCRQVMVHYLDNLYAVKTEVVTLNGVTPVNTVATNILRVNAFHCFATGTGLTTAGNISLTAVGGAVTYGYITAGNNTARQAIYTVPAGYNGYISHWQASVGSSTGTHFTQIDLRMTAHDGVAVPGVFLLVDGAGLTNNAQPFTLPTPILVPPMTDVKMSVISDAANANAVTTGTIMGWFEKQ